MKTLFLNLWYKCNYDCVYCVIWWIQEEFWSEDFVSLEKIKEIDLNWYNTVRLTWGEPTIHPDFFEILNYFYEKNFWISMQTNWSMLWQKQFYNKIKNYKINYQLPLNSYIENIHNIIMKHKNAFNLTIDWIKNLLLNDKSTLTVKIILTKLNYSHLSKTVEFLISIWVKRFYIAYPVIKWNYLKYPKLVPKYSEIKKELDLLVDIEEKYKIHYVLESFPYCVLKKEQYKNVWEISQFERDELLNSSTNDLKELLDISINCFKKYWDRDDDRNCDTCKIVNFKHKLNNVSFLHKKLDKEINANCLDNKHKIKLDSCLKCSYNLLCTGVSKEYFKTHWFWEFNNTKVFKDINSNDLIKYIDYINENE